MPTKASLLPLRRGERDDLIYRDYVLRQRRTGLWHRGWQWLKYQLVGETRRRTDPPLGDRT